MITLTVKGLSPTLHRRLKSRAAAHGRSLNTEVIACLEASVHSGLIDVEAVLRNARAVRSAVRVCLTQRDLAAGRGEGRS